MSPSGCGWGGDPGRELTVRVTPSRVEGVRSKAERLATTGLVTKDEAGVFVILHRRPVD
jgi:hypothetical protein